MWHKFYQLLAGCTTALITTKLLKNTCKLKSSGFSNFQPLFNNVNICDPTWVNEADVGRGQFWDTFIFVFYMDYRLFQYQDHGYGMFHSKVMMNSNLQLSLKPNTKYLVTANWRIDFFNK